MSDQLFVPADFMVPDGLTTGEFRLEPLGPQHNTADYAAWTASIGHIQATPGFAGSSWPHQIIQLCGGRREGSRSILVTRRADATISLPWPHPYDVAY